ncbi:hypothetical protein D3C85_356000 [compost metagenome]
MPGKGYGQDPDTRAKLRGSRALPALSAGYRRTQFSARGNGSSDPARSHLRRDHSTAGAREPQSTDRAAVRGFAMAGLRDRSIPRVLDRPLGEPPDPAPRELPARVSACVETRRPLQPTAARTAGPGRSTGTARDPAWGRSHPRPPQTAHPG